MLRAISDRIDVVAAAVVGLAGAIGGLDKPLTVVLGISAGLLVLGMKFVWRRLKGSKDA